MAVYKVYKAENLGHTAKKSLDPTLAHLLLGGKHQTSMKKTKKTEREREKEGIGTEVYYRWIGPNYHHRTS